jgi:hypothetical protein
MQNQRRIRLLRRFVLGLAVAAIVAPAAQAHVPTPESRVFDGSGAAVRPADEADGVVLRRSRPAVLVHGENKADLPEAAYVPFVSDFPRTAPAPGGGDASPLGYRHALPQDYGVVPVEVVRAPSTFDWGDALIGAGGALALLLLAGGAAVATRHVRRPAAA